MTDQLEVTEAAFWACVDGRKLPDRAPAAEDAPTNALPAGLVYQLIHTVGVFEAEVVTTSLERALEMANDFWFQPPD